MTPIKTDVMVITYSSKNQINVENVSDARDLRRELIGDSPYYPIVDFRDGFINFSSEAKEWIALNRESINVRIIDILLINNRAMKLEAKLYLKFYNPITPTKIVTSMEDALDLIRKHKLRRQDLFDAS